MSGNAILCVDLKMPVLPPTGCQGCNVRRRSSLQLRDNKNCAHRVRSAAVATKLSKKATRKAQTAQKNMEDAVKLAAACPGRALESIQATLEAKFAYKTNKTLFTDVAKADKELILQFAGQPNDEPTDSFSRMESIVPGLARVFLEWDTVPRARALVRAAQKWWSGKADKVDDTQVPEDAQSRTTFAEHLWEKTANMGPAILSKFLFKTLLTNRNTQLEGGAHCLRRFASFGRHSRYRSAKTVARGSANQRNRTLPAVRSGQRVGKAGRSGRPARGRADVALATRLKSKARAGANAKKK